MPHAVALRPFLFKIQTEHKIYKTKEIQQGRRFYNLIMYFNYFILKVFIF